MASGKKKPSASAELDLQEQVKKLVIVAMFSDNDLMERLVLKGGNALDLVHRVSTRASTDVDFSMTDDFPVGGLDAVRDQIAKTLQATFRLAGYEAFDVKLEERPKEVTSDLACFWGGYRAEFKLIERAKYAQLSSDLGALRRQATKLGQGSTFLIDISKYEYTLGKVAQDLDGYRIYVYTPEMIVCEKLRAICQQMPEYGPVVKRNRAGSPRARDFIDIHTLVAERGIDISSGTNRELLKNVFAAKRVPLQLLGLVSNYREFHRTDFPAVQATVKPGVELKSFDFYFDFVVGLCKRLEPLWNE